MPRIQISLTEAQSRRLESAATERALSVPTIIREAIDLFVADAEVAREERLRRARGAVGRYRSSASDVSERHDDYLVDDLARFSTGPDPS